MTQSEPHKSISTIQTTFARLMDHFGHQLPDDDVLHRRGVKAIWPLRWMFINLNTNLRCSGNFRM